MTKERNLSKAAAYNTQLGLNYLKQGDRPRAKRKLIAALKQEPLSADVNSALAYYFEETGQTDQAKSFYSKALALAPGSGAQLNNYGAFLCRQKQFAQAIDYFLKAVHDNQYINSAGAYENAGLCAEEIPDNEKSLLYFTKALEQDPTRKQSFYELVKIENQQGHQKKVLELFSRYPELSKGPEMMSLAKELASASSHLKVQEQYIN